MRLFKNIRLSRKNNIIDKKIKKLKNLCPEDIFKERRENWSKRRPSHASIFGQREAALQIIEADIEAVLNMHDSRIYVITDFDMNDSDCTAKNISRYKELQLMDRCEVYNFNILNDRKFLEQIYSRRETESIWLYIVGASDEVCTEKMWCEIERLIVCGRKYDVIVTFASAGMNLKNDYLRTIVSNTVYFLFTPSKDIDPEDVRRVLDIKNTSHLKYYKTEHENAALLPVVIATPFDEFWSGYKTYSWFLQLNLNSNITPSYEDISALLTLLRKYENKEKYHNVLKNCRDISLAHKLQGYKECYLDNILEEERQKHSDISIENPYVGDLAVALHHLELTIREWE